MLASETNRLHKLLTDAGIRLGVVVSDFHSQSARAMVKALIAGKSVPDVLSLASNRLRPSREDVFEALQAEEITPAQRFVLTEIMAHIKELEARMARFDVELLRSLRDAGYGMSLQLLQTLPGIDLMGAAMLLDKVPADMRESFSPDQLLALKVALGGRTWGAHALDARWTLKLWRWQYYFVVLAGRNRRSLTQRQRQVQRLSLAIFLALFLLLSTAVGLVVPNLVKSALGIDLLPGFSLGLWGWFQETVLR